MTLFLPSTTWMIPQEGSTEIFASNKKTDINHSKEATVRVQ